MQMLMPATYVPGYAANNNAMFTNRLRLNFDAKVADNVTVAARLSMYKVFGNSTGVQVFDGQPTTLYRTALRSAFRARTLSTWSAPISRGTISPTLTSIFRSDVGHQRMGRL